MSFSSSKEILLELPPAGTRCTDVLGDTLRGYAGIKTAEFNLETGQVLINYDSRVLNDELALRIIRKAGEEAYGRVLHCAAKNDATCAACTAVMNGELLQHYQRMAQGKIPVQTGYQDGLMEIQLNPDTLPGPTGELAAAEIILAPPKPLQLPKPIIKREQLEVIFTTVTFLAALTAFLGDRFALFPNLVVSGIYLLAYLTGGFYGLLDGLKVLRERRLDVNLLMILAAIGAALIGQPAEGATLLFLFSFSNTLQTFAMDRSRQAIEKLLDLRPPVATVRRGSRLVSLPVEGLVLSDIASVKPGERFPIDGTVESGSSTADQATITGELIPVPKKVGDTVFAGTVNGNGALEVKVTRLAQDTTLARIVQMVEDAQSNKAQTQRMLDNFEQIYALLVLGGALLLILIPLLLFNQEFMPTFYRAMIWLVVASPCALVISTPASILSAIANGARRGILFKGGVHLEQTATIKVIAFDKTGTLTTGMPSLNEIYPYGAVNTTELLRLAAVAESRSEHPLASAIVNAATTAGLRLPVATDFQAITGQGIEANVEGQSIWIGNERMFHERRISIPEDFTR